MTTALLAWVLVVAYSLAPFDFKLAELGSRIANPGSLFFAPDTSLRDLVLHFAAFVPVGVLHRLALDGAVAHSRRWSIISGLIACALIEAAQIGAPGRHGAVLDLLTNGSGLLLGAMVAPEVQRRLGTLREPLRSHGRSRLRRWSVLMVWALFWSVAFLYPLRLVALDGWDPSYALVVGDEVGGGRAWSGDIEYVAFYDRAFEAGDAAVTARLPPGSPEGAALRRRLGLVERHEYTSERIAAVRRQQAGTPVLEQDAATLVRRLIDSGSFTIEVRCTPAPGPQTGPARIVGISNGIWMRNVTLGQEGLALEFRVRNPLNGPNGLEYALRSRDVLTGGAVQIVAAYAGGRSTIYVNGHSAGDSANLRSPAVILGLGTTTVASAAAWLIAALSLVVCFGVTAR